MGKKNKLANQESNTNLEKEVSPESEINFMNTSKASLKEYSKSAPFAFDARNYKLLLLGLAINILGFILMIGGASEDPAQFNADELFSETRITVAPILIVVGYVIVFYSIMKKNKENKD